MQFIAGILLLVGLFAFFILFIGLIQPRWVRMKSRKQVLSWMLGAFVLMILGLLPPKASIEEKSRTAVEETARPSISEIDQLKAELDKAKQEAADAKAALEKSQEAPAAPVAAAVVAVTTEPAPPAPPIDPKCNLEGKVVNIADGDTITVLVEKEQHKIRFSGIDAPEKGQPFSKKSAQYIKDRIGNQTVCVEWHKEDKYQRKVGVVRLNGEDINYGLVKAGLAWHYKKYESEQAPEDRVLYAAAEAQARSDVIGLWSEPDPIEPGDWRAGKRPGQLTDSTPPAQNTSVQQLAAPAPESGQSCGAKRFCKEMSSCAEACHYLTSCGLNRLDRDSDGIPCESICGGQRC